MTFSIVSFDFVTDFFLKFSGVFQLSVNVFAEQRFQKYLNALSIDEPGLEIICR